MGFEEGLIASASAINELRESLEEEGVSEIKVAGPVASFTVTTEDGTAYPFTATFKEHGAASLACPSRAPRGLAKANGKLAAKSSLAKAVAAAGRCVAVDLEWVFEAEGDGGGSDEEMADASDGGSGDEEDREADEMLREWSKRLVKVERVEREIEEKEEFTDISGDLDALQQRQIFDSRSAFRRLANELEEIFKAQDFNMVAEAFDAPEGLYRWHVTLGGFDPASPLAQDMQQAGRRFGSSSVQMHIVFKRPLHPFYPPSVQLVSPRFQGPILGAVASHPLFAIKGWDPTLSARDALLLLKQFLEEHARVDFASARNAGPYAYLPVEGLLAKLEALTGTAAAAQSLSQYQEMYRMREAQAVRQLAGTDAQQAPQAQQQQQTEQQQQQTQQQQQQQQQQPAKKQKSGVGAVAWKAGTGFGHRGEVNAQVWDARRSEAAARDRELADVLQQLAQELSANLLPSASERGPRPTASPPSPPPCLAPYLTQELSAASFQDMARQVRAVTKFYHTLLQCVEALCEDRATSALLTWHATHSARSVASAIAQLEAQVTHFVRVYKQAAAATAAACAGSSKGARGGIKGESEEDKQEVELANHLLEAAAKVAAAAPAAVHAGRGGAAPGAAAAGETAGGEGGAGPSGQGGAEVCAEEAYRLTMSQYRVRISTGVATNHSHRDQGRAEWMQPKLRARRVGRELASCESDLPVSASSSVFVVADEANCNLWKAIITGPENTPYCGGCFLFDIYFPPDYPRVPPKVLIRTTGGGSVRFNPNLYQEGKVCLSLLGTWQGGRGESWSPDYSTVLQVLISIQSLILVDDPYYNEPGYEQRADDSNSNRYSAALMPNTIKWAMLDQLQHPPEYFREVVQQHFRLRGDFILANCRKWVTWCKDKGQAAYARSIEQQLPALEVELRKLAQPQQQQQAAGQ
ncbi:hypothetical protein CHLNCDRAFT_141888 [Chlorella variabilis]|uniref:Ubiquitin-conjugating enzyme E2 Z n=1 Tax=Chlorella variabilis TaxID=554065 RepID=E1Z797_CHLVA|nr:hypothetical protein CHLNCDRAFT_141888 [Chlorella variabilis]EFN57878.1 hypothetical protein CHLNCDRAFT_141888 [Chlorella variabilis]|eukprot:XP_005849980.1 hypothetical protein CHLNCDRAFT_141888 [Chlorella variabilis]